MQTEYHKKIKDPLCVLEIRRRIFFFDCRDFSFFITILSQIQVMLLLLLNRHGHGQTTKKQL